MADHRGRIRWALTFVIGLFLAGLVTDTFEGINKIAATPTWCLWCAALACALWIILYQVMDVAGFRTWAIVVRPAGANPLIAYFLHPIITGLVGLAGYWDTLLCLQGFTRTVGGGCGLAGHGLLCLRLHRHHRSPRLANAPLIRRGCDTKKTTMVTGNEEDRP